MRYDDAVEALVNGYSVFDFSRGITKNRRNLNGPFWRAFHSMRGSISRDDNADMLATNLFRFDVDQGRSVIKHCDPDELREILNFQRGLLAREIRVLKPTAVLFFTGPSYDLALQDEFDGIEIYPLSGRSERQFAGVRHPDLPPIAIRTYHPGYLNRSREKRSWLEDIGHYASA